jgi:polyisoprenoid-binding protein YceI
VPNGHTLGPRGNERAGFSGKTSIDRREFGLIGNPALDSGGLVVGECIHLEIEVEAVRQPAVRAA